MSENDNDFMGSSFSNYDVTENRMGGTGAGSGTGEDHKKMYFEVAGRATSTGRVAAGTAVLIFCEVIAVMLKMDEGSELASFIFVMIGLISAFVIWLYKGKEKTKKGKQNRK